MFHRILTRQGRVDACALARWTHSAFRAYGVFYAGSLPSVVAGSNGLCHSQVIRHSTNGHRAVLHRILSRQCRVDTRTLARWMYNIFCIYGVPRGNFLPLAARHLIGYQLFLLLPQHDSDVYGLFPFYLGGNHFYAVHKRSPTSVQLLLHSNNVVRYIPIPMKSLTQQRLFAFLFATFPPAGSYGWNISTLAFLWVRSYGGKSSTCD